MTPSRSAQTDEVNNFLNRTTRLQSMLHTALETYPKSDCVRFPFHSAYRPSTDQTPTTAQQAAIDWRNLLAERNIAMRGYFGWRGQQHKLALFPLAAFGEVGNFGQSLTADDSLLALEQEIDLLRREMQDLAAQPAANSGRTEPAAQSGEQETEIGERLRQARTSRGEKQEAVAEDLGCSVSTISRIERRKEQPRPALKKKIQQYIDG